MKNKALVPVNTPKYTMQDVSETADRIAISVVLEEYKSTKSEETLRRQKADLECYALYLLKAGVEVSAQGLMTDLSQWCGVSFGIVSGFKRWMLSESYSVGTINVRLATVKRYCQLATEAGEVSHDTLAAIKLVKGYTPKEAVRVDQKRENKRREDSKKAKHTDISIEQSEKLKKQENARDRLLMCMLVDHGFRCGEIAGLRVEDINMSLKHIHIKRPKVNIEGTQEMSKDVYRAMQTYLAEYNPTNFLFMGDSEEQSVSGSYGVRAINRRVEALGQKIGIKKLSPHDIRHFWAWYAAYRGISINRLKQAGGWSTLEMPDRYIGRSEIENEGMV